MRRFLLAVLLLAGGVIGYNHVRSAPERQYKAFAEEMLHRRYAEAAAMTSRLTSSDLAQVGTQEQIGAGPPMFQTLFHSLFNIESREKDPEGNVVLHATQTVLFNPVGVESVRPAMF